MAATITMHNHCQVTKIAVELLNNGTVIVFPKTKSTELIEFEVDSPTCTDQDIKIILENEQGQNMYSKNFRRSNILIQYHIVGISLKLLCPCNLNNDLNQKSNHNFSVCLEKYFMFYN